MVVSSCGWYRTKDQNYLTAINVQVQGAALHLIVSSLNIVLFLGEKKSIFQVGVY